jgi:hypothetical protein
MEYEFLRTENRTSQRLQRLARQLMQHNCNNTATWLRYSSASTGFLQLVLYFGKGTLAGFEEKHAAVQDAVCAVEPGYFCPTPRKGKPSSVPPTGH